MIDVFNAIAQSLVALDYHGIALEWKPAQTPKSQLAGYRIFMRIGEGDWELLTPQLTKQTSMVFPYYNPHYRHELRIEAVDLEGNYTSQTVSFPS